MRKSKDELLNETLNNFSRYNAINATAPGTVTRAFAEVIIEDIDGLYEEIEVSNDRTIPSKSQGVYLDMNAELLGLKRREAESDEELKARMTQQPFILAKGNRIAIEDAIYSVPGVASFTFRRYGRGTGSFVCYVHAQPGYDERQVVDGVTAALLDAVSEGIFPEVRTSKKAVVDMDWVLMFSEGMTESEAREIRQRAKAALQMHLSTLQMTETLYIDQMRSVVRAVSPRILDLGIVTLRVNGQNRYIANVLPENEEEFVAGVINIG